MIFLTTMQRRTKKPVETKKTTNRSQRTCQPYHAFRKENDNIVKPTTSPPTRRHKRLTGKKENSDGSNMALLGLHEWVYKETSCAPRLTLIKRIPTRKGSLKIHVLMRIFPTKKKTLSAKKWMSTLRYYKNPKALINQGTHNLPKLWHSRVVKVL